MKLYGFWRSLATFRVRIALNLKNVPYEEVSIDILQGRQFDDTYRRVNPQSLVPALDTGEGPALFESLAICEYLDERFPAPPLLPKDAAGRARVRGLALVHAADTHPLIVPRIRKYLAQELKQDDAGITRWGQRWFNEASASIEQHLGEPTTGRFCHGDSVTLADLCLVSHFVGATAYFQCDMAPYPTIRRIVDECMKIDAFARAHPLKQPGAPASLGH
jgi:maleylacetoacetate isomerase/maleylpyruvate isomerase